MGEKLGRVELRYVWRWECPECSSVNMEDPPEYNPTKEDMIEQPEFLAAEGEGEWTMAPETVLCPSCLGHFETQWKDAPEGGSR